MTFVTDREKASAADRLWRIPTSGRFGKDSEYSASIEERFYLGFTTHTKTFDKRIDERHANPYLCEVLNITQQADDLEAGYHPVSMRDL